MPSKPIHEFITFLNEICENKQFFCTDATDPPIPITQIFPNITNFIINYPKGTAKLQTVYCDNESVNITNIFYLQYRIDKILKHIEHY